MFVQYIKSYNLALPKGVLAYKFSNNANINEHLVRETFSELGYDTREKHIKNVFIEPI